MATASTTTPLKPFLGNPIEICVVTKDYKRTIAGLNALAIGPWRAYTFTPANTTNQTYYGQSSAFTMKVCFADFGAAGSSHQDGRTSTPTHSHGQSGDPAPMVYEVIQPISGANIFQDFLDAHGEGIHHIAYDCNDMPFAERIRAFEARGWRFAQGGSWMGRNHFAFFVEDGPVDRTGTCFETVSFPADWDYAEPETWFPSRTA
ncbi:hypothetical protein BP5796_09049 [Coleophoma crateriformis]|uniref:VOC domain-containing protein n=1 Tax=Coleophoma crateriformis TaxID=565419 RepID=A0A3D8R2X0_9HELO|nr:hypothetical protein BP5796_09049 [Coleophoma crateriformis]